MTLNQVLRSDLVAKDQTPTDQFDLWEPESIFVPDWSVPIEVTNRYNTVIHTSRTGLEYRSGLAGKPLRTIGYQTLSFSEADIDHWKNSVYRNSYARSLTPLWSDSARIKRLMDPQTWTYELDDAADRRFQDDIDGPGWAITLRKGNSPRADDIVVSKVEDLPLGGTSGVYEGGFGETYSSTPPRVVRGAIKSESLDGPGTGQQTIIVESLYSSSHPSDPAIEVGDYLFIVITMEQSVNASAATMDSLEVRGKGGTGATQTVSLIDDKIAETTFVSDEWPMPNKRQKYIYRIKLDSGVISQSDIDDGYEVVFKRTAIPIGDTEGEQYITLAAFGLKAVDLNPDWPFPDDLPGNSVASNAFTEQPTNTPSTNHWYGNIPNEASLEIYVAWGDTIGIGAFDPSASSITYTGTTDKLYMYNNDTSSIEYKHTHTAGTGTNALAQTLEIVTHAGYTENPASGTYDYSSTFEPNTGGKVEGSFARIRLNPKTSTEGTRPGSRIYPALETDMGFQQSSDVITRRVSSAFVNADETPGVTAHAPIVDIGDLSLWTVNTVEFNLDDTTPLGDNIQVPVLEASSDYTAIEMGSEAIGDTMQVGIGRKKYRYGDNKFYFELPYTCLNRADAFQLIRFFQSRGGRLLPFFLTPPVSQFDIKSIVDQGNLTKVTVVDNGLIDGDDYSSRERIVGKYLSFYDKANASYVVKQIDSVGESVAHPGHLNIFLEGASNITSEAGVGYGRCGIAHLCRFDTDEMVETWITTEHFQTVLTAVELQDEKNVNIDIIRHEALAGCGNHPCISTTFVNSCPSCSDCDDCTNPIRNHNDSNTYLCGYSCGCEDSDALGDNPGESQTCCVCTSRVSVKITRYAACCSQTPPCDALYRLYQSCSTIVDFDYAYCDVGDALDDSCNNPASFPGSLDGAGRRSRAVFMAVSPSIEMELDCNTAACAKPAYLYLDYGYETPERVTGTPGADEENHTCGNSNNASCVSTGQNQRWYMNDQDNWLLDTCLFGDPENNPSSCPCHGMGDPKCMPYETQTTCNQYDQCDEENTTGNRCDCWDEHNVSNCVSWKKFETRITLRTNPGLGQVVCESEWLPTYELSACSVYSSCIAGCPDPNHFGHDSEGGCP